MPIGKNAIKRVTNNGYSNVKTTAPDMENSIVTEAKKPVEKKKSTVAEKSKTAAAQEAPKAAANKTSATKAEKKVCATRTSPAPQKSMETEPELAPAKTLEKVVKSTQREGNGYVNLGGKLPYYLL